MMAAAPEAHELAIAVVQFLVPDSFELTKLRSQVLSGWGFTQGKVGWVNASAGARSLCSKDQKSTVGGFTHQTGPVILLVRG